MTKLKPWIQVVEPHEDIRKGRFDESVFAADIGAVLADRGAVEYRDPDLFFKKTYFTQEISSLLSSILLRLSGKKGIEPVVQLQTPFGGGKTHTLLAIYHLVKNKNNAIKSKDIKKILDKNNLKQIPDAKIAIIDGEAVNAGTIRKTLEGIEIKTLWGEIAYQIGGVNAFRIVEKDDKNRVSPGSNKIASLIKEFGPIMVLLDETLKYLTKASGIIVGESTLAAQTISFMQELTEAFANSEKSILFASLVSSSSDFSDENEERMFQRLSKVFGRVEAIKEPIKGEEIYEVIRKRLFENLGDESAAKEAASVYWEFYQKNKEDFPRHIRELSYKKLMERAYPFHPEFLNILRERWGTITEFQKTRGVLRILALIVSDLYKRKHSGALIQASHVNLGNPEILSELLKYAGRQFEGVVASDISGPTAKAPQIDRELGSEYAKESITEGIATSIFMHSFSAKTENGVAENQLRLSILHPNVPVAIFADSLNRARDRFYYLDEKNHLYRFTDVINLNKRIVDKEDTIRSEDVKKHVQNKLWDMLGTKFMEKNRFPEEDTDIPDTPRPRLIVLSLDHTKGRVSWKDTEKFINHLLNSYGTKHRRFKNVLIFLVPDELLQDQLQKTVKRYQALTQIDEEYKTRKGLSEEQKKQLQFKIKNIETELPTLIASTYRHIVVANDKNKLKLFDMGTIVYSPTNPISNIVWQTLKENEKLIERLDPQLLISTKWGLWPKGKNAINIKVLWEYFAQYTNLPILANESALKSCITQGVSRGLFAYAFGDGKKFEKPIYNRYIEEENIEISDTSWLIKPEIAIKLLPREEQVAIKKITKGGTTSIVIERPEVKRKPGIKTVKELTFDASLDWQNWQNFFTYILSPLTEENADIKIELKLESKSGEGISQDKIDAILESISQICKEWKIKKKE